MNTRKKGNSTTIHDFINKVLVECPSYSAKAKVDKRRVGVNLETRLICTNCGMNKTEVNNELF